MSNRTFVFITLLLVIFVTHASDMGHAREGSPNHEKYFKIADRIVQTALTDTAGYHLLRRLSWIGPRLPGSREAAEAVRWAEATMKDLGFDKVWLQEVTVPRWVRGKIERANCVIPTGQNHANIHFDLQKLVPELASQGMGEEEISKRAQMLVRAYDPCISCSVH